LAQSPQFYKQMAVCGDFGKVFEIGHVFRAENTNTLRHMTEFIGLDIEMAFMEHYHEVLNTLDELFAFMFAEIPKRLKAELEIVSQQYPFEPFEFKFPSPHLTFKEGIDLLKAEGIEHPPFEDLTTVVEKQLGGIVKKKYGSDFYRLDKYPLSVRPFYTMPDPEDNRYSNSYDLFIRGQEIASGSQRIHDPVLLTERAKHHKVDLKTIESYVDAFRYGAPPHAGGGIGLERVVFLYLGLHSVHMASLFPRTPKRLTP